MIEIKNLREEKPKEVYDIKVDRTSVLGNPFFMKDESERDKVCDKYETYFINQMFENEKFKDEFGRLLKIYQTEGKLNLYCWCYPKRCHAETIAKYIKMYSC